MNKHTPNYYKFNFWCWLKGKHKWNYVTNHKRECTRCHTYEVEIYNRRLNRMYTWIDATIFRPKGDIPILDENGKQVDKVLADAANEAFRTGKTVVGNSDGTLGKPMSKDSIYYPDGAREEYENYERDGKSI